MSRFSIRRYAKKIYNHVRFVTAVYVICYFFDLKFHLFKASIRYGMRCTQLMYSHSTVFVACCVFLIGILLAVSNYNNDWKKCLGILLFLMCTTLRSKAWGIAIAIVLICYFTFYRKKKITIKTLLLFVPLVVTLAWNQIYYYFFSSVQGGLRKISIVDQFFQSNKRPFPYRLRLWNLCLLLFR